MNRTWKPLLLIALGGCIYLSPTSVSAQNSCRVRAVFVRPDFVRPGFDKIIVVRSAFDRPSLERAALDRPDLVRPAFERATFIRPVFDDPCVNQGDPGRSSSRSSYVSGLGLTGEKDSKLAQNGPAKTEIPRHGVVLAAREKSSDSAMVGSCCGQQPVIREQQHRLYR